MSVQFKVTEWKKVMPLWNRFCSNSPQYYKKPSTYVCIYSPIGCLHIISKYSTCISLTTLLQLKRQQILKPLATYYELPNNCINTFIFLNNSPPGPNLTIINVTWRKPPKNIFITFKNVQIRSFKELFCKSLASSLKVAFFRKCDVFFKSPSTNKQNIPNHYPELGI